MAAMQTWMTRAAEVRRRRHLVRDAREHGDGMIDFASNDYLDLSRDPRVVEAAVCATRQDGAGARASRLVTGTLPVHTDLEAALCELTGQATALAFSSGYTANLAVLTALGGPDTLVVLDEHVHASLIDGARLSRSPVVMNPHRDLERLRAMLAQRTQRRALVVVESVYSVLGDTADLVEVAALCAEHDAILVVDEAHGVGVLGEGRGAVHAARLHARDEVVVTATLSKALGAMGGAVLGSELIREHLVNTARSFVYDTGLAPAPAAAAAAACRIILTEPQRVRQLQKNADLLARAAGVPRAPGPVQSVPVGTAERARRLADSLYDQGQLVGCFRPPSVPDGVSRIRLTAHSGHRPDDIDRVGELLRAGLAEQEVRG
ncbi:8-amino-7-oxononanoate synthase [Microbacterium sp. X-17]|uniref:8-amino-7-oxononanoate synthase n=1 Tax=Microbacterium sp. X-17 TaxID=3144404 RepID=UPI0031F4DC49